MSDKNPTRKYLVGRAAHGGFPAMRYLRIEVVEAGSASEASSQHPQSIWVSEYSESIPGGMMPKKVKHKVTRVTDDSVKVVSDE